MNIANNSNKSGCVPTSSNCVKWQGPAIEGLSLCQGSSVTEVIMQLSEKLNEIYSSLNITDYDLACFELGKCGPQEFSDLIQLIINKICELNGSDKGITDINSIYIDIPNCLKEEAGKDQNGNYIKTLPLVTFARLLGNKICSISQSISELTSAVVSIQSDVNTLSNKVTSLESTKLDKGIALKCDGTEGKIYDIVNENTKLLCGYKSSLGTSESIVASVSKQDCALNTTHDYYFSDPTQKITDDLSSEKTIAATISNIWTLLCDARDEVARMKEENDGLYMTVDANVSCDNKLHVKFTKEKAFEGNINTVSVKANSQTFSLESSYILQDGEATIDLGESSDTTKCEITVKYYNSFGIDKTYRCSIVALRSITDLNAQVYSDSEAGKIVVVSFNKNNTGTITKIYRGNTLIKTYNSTESEGKKVYEDNFSFDEGETYTYKVVDDGEYICGSEMDVYIPITDADAPTIQSGDYTYEGTTINEVPPENYSEWEENYQSTNN